MALNSSEMKTKFQSRIYASLQRVFQPEINGAGGYDPIALQQWERLADAISDIAMDIVDEIQTTAEVIPGQSVVGTFVGTGSGPIQGTTITTGKIT